MSIKGKAPLATIPVPAAKPQDQTLRNEAVQHQQAEQGSEGSINNIADNTVNKSESESTNAQNTEHSTEQSTTELPVASKTGYCGFTFNPISSYHACTDCGKIAEGMLKRWDGGALVWARYACRDCSTKHIDEANAKLSA